MRPLSKYLSANEAEAIQRFIEKLQDKFGQDIEDVRLFGSKARGEAKLDSDLDIFILVKSSDYALKHAILWLAAEVSLRYDVLLSPRVLPLTAWEQMAEGNTLFYRTVCADGVPLLNPSQSTPIT
jgi:predicted nucleotidyltransferase